MANSALGIVGQENERYSYLSHGNMANTPYPIRATI